MKLWEYIEYETKMILENKILREEYMLKEKLQEIMSSYGEKALNGYFPYSDSLNFFVDMESTINCHNFKLWGQLYDDIDSYDTIVSMISLYKNTCKDYESYVELNIGEKYISSFRMYMPITEEEIDNIFEKMGWSNLNFKAWDVMFDNKAYYAIPKIEDIKSLYEINYLSYCVSKMSDEQKNVLSKAILLYNPSNVKDLINLSANLDGICIVNGIDSMEELGEFFVENGLWKMEIQDELLPWLDYAKIANNHIDTHKGLFKGGYYIEDTLLEREKVEIYNGVNLLDMDFTESNLKEIEQGM